MSKKLGYISSSQIQQYTFCPLWYKSIYVDEANKVEPNAYMIYGTTVHQVLAENNKTKKATGSDYNIERCMELFDEFLLKNAAQERIRIDSALASTFRMSAEMSLSYYLENIAPCIKPLLIEEKFEITLSKYPITIKGFFDLVTEDYEIIDYKTVGKQWKLDYTDKKITDSIQGNLYAVAARKLFKQKEKRVCFCVMPRGEKICHQRCFIPNEDTINKLLGIATDIEELNKMGIYVPNLHNCSKCQLKNTCSKRVAHIR